MCQFFVKEPGVCVGVGGSGEGEGAPTTPTLSLLFRKLLNSLSNSTLDYATDIILNGYIFGFRKGQAQFSSTWKAHRSIDHLKIGFYMSL